MIPEFNKIAKEIVGSDNSNKKEASGFLSLAKNKFKKWWNPEHFASRAYATDFTQDGRKVYKDIHGNILSQQEALDNIDMLTGKAKQTVDPAFIRNQEAARIQMEQARKAEMDNFNKANSAALEAQNQATLLAQQNADLQNKLQIAQQGRPSIGNMAAIGTGVLGAGYGLANRQQQPPYGQQAPIVYKI